MPDPDFTPNVEGEVVKLRPEGGEPQPWTVAADGIALSPDGARLYYSPLSSLRLYSVSTMALADPGMSDAEVAETIEDLGEKGASDGLIADAEGRVYGGDYENNAIRVLEEGEWRTIAQAPDLLWPDTLSIGPDGMLYVTVNQLHRQPGFHFGEDLREPPYKIMRIDIGAEPIGPR